MVRLVPEQVAGIPVKAQANSERVRMSTYKGAVKADWESPHPPEPEKEEKMRKIVEIPDGNLCGSCEFLTSVYFSNDNGNWITQYCPLCPQEYNGSHWYISDGKKNKLCPNYPPKQ